MQVLRKSAARGHVQQDWLESYHSFSFAEYYDPDHMHFGALGVINEDVVAPSQGFGMHGHRDMEIITYVLSGQLRHQDSLGNGATMGVGEVQRMSAGTGVRHSEFNPSPTEPVHLLQIWLTPSELGLPPSYEQKAIPTAEKQGKLCAIAGPEGQGAYVRIHQDATLWAGVFDGGASCQYQLASGRRAYLHLARGSVRVNDQHLDAGDALMVTDEKRLDITQGAQAEILLFDLA